MHTIYNHSVEGPLFMNSFLIIVLWFGRQGRVESKLAWQQQIRTALLPRRQSMKDRGLRRSLVLVQRLRDMGMADLADKLATRDGP